MLKQFTSIRQGLTRELEALSQLALARNEETTLHALGELAEKLEENRFHLVVLGEFKRGKTTFINALLGQELLPSGVVPVTAIITMIKYGDSLRVRVFYLDGRDPKEITPAELPDYVSEAGNPENEKGVKYIELEFPSPYLADGVVLIDTPGVGSIYAHNTETAYDFLPRVDAAIFLISADPPVSQGELEFLQDVQQYVKQIFFVQNKIDYVSDDKLVESLRFSQKAINRQLGYDVTIFPVSAKTALEAKISGDAEKLGKSRLPQFEQALDKFLLEEKGKTLLQSTLARAQRLQQDLCFSLNLELKAAATPVQELQDKINTFEEQLAAIEEKREQNRFLLEEELKKLIARLEERVEEFKEDLTAKLQGEVQQCWNEHRELGNRELAATLSGFLKNSIITHYTCFRKKTEKWLRQELHALFSHYAEQANTIIEEILKLSAGLFDLQLEGFSRIEPLTAESDFYFKLEDAPHFFTIDPTTISVLLPRPLAQRRILNTVLAKVPHQVDRTSGRVRYDFVERVKKSARQFQGMLEEKIDATCNGIKKVLQGALARRQQSEVQFQKQQEGVQEQLQQLAKINIQLEHLQQLVEEL